MENDQENVAKSPPLVQDDLLGLDQEIKLTKRARVARLDNQRIFNPVTGLDYILKHHRDVTKTIQKNDKKFNKKYYNQSVSRVAKYDHEYDNLSTVLQFYQLWCHGLFPKANFRDCIHLLRRLGAKSSQLRLYRRELIDKEIEKLKIAKGIIDDHDEEMQLPTLTNENSNGNDNENANENATFGSNSQAENGNTPQDAPMDDIDDDWSFMNIPKTRNNLFVGDDDDDADDDELYMRPSNTIPRPQLDPVAGEVTENIPQLGSGTSRISHEIGIQIERPQLEQVGDITNEIEPEVSIEPPTLTSIADVTAEESDDPFSDDDDEVFHTLVEDEPPNENDIVRDNGHDDDELSMELMREMGI
jgi:replication fork protection complex subunit Csm3/Swi3